MDAWKILRLIAVGWLVLGLSGAYFAIRAQTTFQLVAALVVGLGAVVCASMYLWQSRRARESPASQRDSGVDPGRPSG